MLLTGSGCGDAERSWPRQGDAIPGVKRKTNQHVQQRHTWHTTNVYSLSIYLYMYICRYVYMYIFYADICNHISNWGIPVCIFHVRLAGVSAEQRSLLAPAGSSRPGNA